MHPSRARPGTPLDRSQDRCQNTHVGFSASDDERVELRSHQLVEVALGPRGVHVLVEAVGESG